MEKKPNALWLYAASGLIPLALLLANFALLGIAPFGERTVLLYDSAYQYLDFAAYLKTVFSGENDLIYTFSKNLGGEMVSLFCYYLLSPFSLLFALGSVESLPLVFTLVAALKTAACGVTFCYGAAQRFGRKWSHLIFSTAYALMAYNVLYGWNIMWMDGVLVLPLLALGLENLWKGKRPWLYAGSLAYALLTNFYIGYMLCIASVLFSAALMAVSRDSMKVRCRYLETFLLASGIGGFAAAFCWLPTFFTLIGGRAAAASSVFVWTRTFHILGLAGKLVAGSANAEQVTLGTPHVFCGLFTVFLAAVYFLNGKNCVRERLAALGVLGVLLVSFCIRGLDVIWHGFSPNNAFNFRYAFLFSYVLLVLAQYAWEQRREVGKVWILLSGVLLLVMCAGLLVMKRFMGLDFISVAGITVSAVAVLAAAGYLLLGSSARQLAGIAFAIVCLFEMGANYYLSMSEVMKEAALLQLPAYARFVQQTGAAVAEVKAMDSGFYRMEKTYSRNKNDPMLFAYNGLTHFSSSQDKAVPRFMKALGMTSMEGIWSEYGSGSTASVDTLLGVKYVLSGNDLAAQKGYLLLKSADDIHIYENPHVLPMAMVAGGDAVQIHPEEENCFMLQNRMIQEITGENGEVFRAVEDVAVTLENLIALENGIYTKGSSGEEGALVYTLEISEASPLYLYFDAPELQNVSLYIDGTYKGGYFDQYRWDIVYAGTYAPGERVEIRLVPNSGEMAVEEALFFYEDMEALSAAAEKIRSNPVQLRRESSSHLTGTVETTREGRLLLTIPYDRGWKLKVDGVPTEFTQAMGIFMAADIAPGSHSFELRYVPRGSLAGCGISAAAVAAAILWEAMLRKKKNKEKG